MTATSRARRGTIRLFSMESLGFIDPPSQSWTTPPTALVTDEESEHETNQTTELFEIPLGKHTRRAEPTGELVTDIWGSTELHAPSLVDWAPQTISTQKLGQRNFRWPVALSLVIGGLAIAALGFWLFTRPDSAAAAAMAVVEDEARNLSQAFELSDTLIADLDAERLPEAGQDSTVYFDIAEAARSMFAASADLPQSDSEDRAAAADAASLAMDASRQLMDATAYRTALEPALTLPILETDPALTDLTTATAAFTEWRAGFEAVLEALPAGISGQSSLALDEIATGLEAVQTAYLDALRTGDRAAAVEAIGGLKADLVGVRQGLLTDMTGISDSVSAVIEQARERLALLLG
jgi:hypothetical protein